MRQCVQAADIRSDGNPFGLITHRRYMCNSIIYMVHLVTDTMYYHNGIDTWSTGTHLSCGSVLEMMAEMGGWVVAL